MVDLDKKTKKNNGSVKTVTNGQTNAPSSSSNMNDASRPPVTEATVDSTVRSVSRLIQALIFAAVLQVLYRALVEAYTIRLHAINEYGRVIHEFDPYFNYRATEYLYEHGWQAFCTWFDYLVWYPLGRPVGTTIYPGMQVTAVALKNYVLTDMSINDICCFIPAWFGVTATMAVFALSFECTRSTARYDIVPAHLLRSIGGGYDNESIAMTAMVLTFAVWTRALRDTPETNGSGWLPGTMLWGALTGVAYFYMVAAWGGYVFVLNVIGVHASVLVLLGRYSTKLHRAYSCFYVVGTALAIQVPVVGWTPLKSLEQMGPLAAFLGMQLLEVCAVIQRKNPGMSQKKIWKLRMQVFGGAGLIGAALVFLLLPNGYFGPFSSRVRGLFVKHTKTGNPLVDSVAEHQAASPEAYFQYLHKVCYLAPVGLLMVCLFSFNDSSSFLLVYGVAAYFFSHKMVRLILLTAPIASVTAGIALGKFVSWARNTNGDGEDDVVAAGQPLYMRIVRLAIFGAVAFQSIPEFKSFWQISHEVAVQVSHPTIIQKAQRRDTGETIFIDDYRQAYLWLKNNTPEDARIMAWWDYGYQITGIGNRTTIADGNTWNHEHIALLGRTLTAPEKEGHRIARHLADYVLVWAGGGGDDVAKSPHLRRIANSVYRGLCREPTCRDFGFQSKGNPTADMRKSLLYKLHSHNLVPDVQADRNRFREVFTSTYGKVRIYKILSVSKESKDWVANPENRVCDAPGSWMCRGQYPPALKKVLSEKKDFKQLEDFNAKSDHDDSDYQREYMENVMHKKQVPRPRDSKSGQEPKEPKEQPSARHEVVKLSDEKIEALNQNWENNERTTLMWELISENRLNDMVQLLYESPELVHLRSADGRGPMFWAHEYGRSQFLQVFRQLGVREDRKDAVGKTALDMA
ncbi:oligosaccharyl transferase [Phaeodactylum tricornutum CCAP 1055/1]|uniref:dolichyl-diphosphooligosaccharide--protein glycotransferase n=1 Tax=Phaeodactylum tricornutum (strain CCAP 1055/1) TaxID=556484 RepID=B7GE38_PHATC|nr:oligosaccharyl transferase [Phaeodactylum tricornutum CCAP 1055/1]EEC43036.1 oligosaccharyl transferase [Phaeodactylum tricornutum CCAP 1055/1]|eukprot:XP_002185367.1 oligosaccharyl transferase [Phaeodactylum tricornutum CCAP 1055/1]